MFTAFFYSKVAGLLNFKFRGLAKNAVCSSYLNSLQNMSAVCHMENREAWSGNNIFQETSNAPSKENMLRFTGESSKFISNWLPSRYNSG